jgi:hypothetical protein
MAKEFTQYDINIYYCKALNFPFALVLDHVLGYNFVRQTVYDVTIIIQ